MDSEVDGSGAQSFLGNFLVFSRDPRRLFNLSTAICSPASHSRLEVRPLDRHCFTVLSRHSRAARVVGVESINFISLLMINVERAETLFWPSRIGLF